VIASNILFQENDLIYIAVSGINQPEYINVVKNILSKMYSHNFIQFTTNIVKADIVISDCAIGNTTKEVNFVFMDCIQKKENWEKLTLLIQSLIMEKCVYKNLTMIGK
ncbi:M protein trans-acting positive regulator, partial [Enterococcus casseliflavus]